MKILQADAATAYEGGRGVDTITSFQYISLFEKQPPS